MNDKAKKLVPHFPPTGLRKFIRTASTGAAAAVIAVGVLFTAVASVPASQPSGKDGDVPMRFYGLIESVGETETAPEGVTLTQIVAVLERAEKEAREQGPNFSPTIAQAAAELGMLYTTYQMQQLSFGPNNEGLRPDDAPDASGSGSEEDAEDPASGPGKQAASAERDGADARDGADQKSGAKQDDGERSDSDSDSDGDRAGDKEDAEQPRPEEDTPPAVEVSNEPASVTDPHDEDPETGHVTYDEVVIAAVRLANLLDPSVPNALVEVDGVEQGKGNRSGVSLRESLLDIVSLFGGTTTGYLNGRIPADVLCPLEFAPGHMLRCDAAERFTALNEQFEAEFGYSIPITDSYRSYGAQVTLAGIKPHLAAIPGTSNHGWGIAVDLGNPIAGGNSAEYVWLRLHGPDYGWDNPSWARLGGAKPEPWHFEFFAAGSIPNRAIDSSDVGTWKPSDTEPPRYKPALDPKPKDDEPAGGVRKPATKPSDQPSDNPPSQKPSKPTPKPTPSDPTDEPTRPKPPPTTTTPKPTPTPTPSDPTPTPSPSEPSEEPSDEPSEQPSEGPSGAPSGEPSDECQETEPETNPSPAPSTDATDDATAGSTAPDSGTESGTDEDPCAVPDEAPEDEADASSSGLVAILPKSTSVVTASRRSHPRG